MIVLDAYSVGVGCALGILICFGIIGLVFLFTDDKKAE